MTLPEGEASARIRLTRESSFFPKDSRETKYGQIMRSSGYVETPEALEAVKTLRDNGPKDIGGYFCANCEYFSAKFSSPTGFWCRERLFPDKPEGCCNFWRPKD